LPTAWTVFFGTFTVALFLIDENQLPFLSSNSFKFSFLALFLVFFFIQYFTVLKLMRVELASDHYIVSNYLKSYRLIYDDIDTISYLNLGRLKWVKFKLKAKGSLGKKITFLASTNLLKLFLEQHPEVKLNFDSKSK
jgi:hypothetical protein